MDSRDYPQRGKENNEGMLSESLTEVGETLPCVSKEYFNALTEESKVDAFIQLLQLQASSQWSVSESYLQGGLSVEMVDQDSAYSVRVILQSLGDRYYFRNWYHYFRLKSHAFTAMNACFSPYDRSSVIVLDQNGMPICETAISRALSDSDLCILNSSEFEEDFSSSLYESRPPKFGHNRVSPGSVEDGDVSRSGCFSCFFG